ncbi:hypothetical protein ASD19_06320 [Microbacterium sp. Root53]|uniref:hypothetical protein n=1 Tax=Microbacterium sp. Root53 TaxID=1736553 RepID=UPI0006FBAC68|nr:hypothetical protein [Microbacterium sp. Root53]KQY98820.1 hypothetical protein ASD19_06320 [Microbacterium sp. Root53]
MALNYERIHQITRKIVEDTQLPPEQLDALDPRTRAQIETQARAQGITPAQMLADLRRSLIAQKKKAAEDRDIIERAVTAARAARGRRTR